jgi:molecular chaperone GrpE
VTPTGDDPTWRPPAEDGAPSAGGEELADTREALAEAEARLQRVAADLANAQRRHEEHVARARRSDRVAFLAPWLEVIDNLHRAAAHADEAPAGALREGLKAIARQADELLGKAGVRRMDVVGQPFDPRQHEAVATRSGAPRGVVLEELQPGWLADDGAVLRPAQVVVTGE